MKVYLDNNVVSALGRDDTPQESTSLSAVLQAFDAGTLDLCTSKVTGDEIEKYKGDKKRFVEFIYRLLKKVPYVESQKLLGINVYVDRYTCINSPMIENHPIWARLRAIGLDQVVAHHVMLAIKAGCAVFLTCDRRLLNRASHIEQEFKIRIIRPSDLVKEISTL